MIGFHRIWSRESSEPSRLGNPNAVSPKGAAGPMQLMPATAVTCRSPASEAERASPPEKGELFRL
ncbi:lytic transglycosylase domain-containing protein [Edaphobacter bradus]|uniref:lytic transglycosylase domain-containing protein n=1 Tax=Edaphobacter bradus TaxID=2259016 RepID=UPI0037C113AC